MGETYKDRLNKRSLPQQTPNTNRLPKLHLDPVRVVKPPDLLTDRKPLTHFPILGRLKDE